MIFRSRFMFFTKSLFFFSLFFLFSSSQVFPQASMDSPHDLLNEGCIHCHDFTAWLQPNMILNLGGGTTEDEYESLCIICHTGNGLDGEGRLMTGHSSGTTSSTYHNGNWSAGCSVCHNQHVQPTTKVVGNNGGFIRNKIDLRRIVIEGSDNVKAGLKNIQLVSKTGSNSFADGNTTYDGICEVCHTTTRHFQNNGLATDQLHSVDENGKPAKVGPGNNCTMCHKHENGFTANMPSHSAVPGSDWVMVFEEGSHDSVMTWDGEIYAECKMCHNTELSAAHDYQCLLCHPSPAETVVGSWGGGCQQGGCHVTIHTDASAAHNTVDDNCNNCHDPVEWWPTSEACPNCHAVYNPADTIPPVTTSNAKASYLGPARIEYTVKDSGKVVVAQSYSRVDNGPAVMGSSIFITETGNHNLKFWSVDQANNIESPPKEVNFAVVQDTIPPVTTSNAQAAPYIYYNNARISFSSSDEGDLGVKTTYYSLDGGPTQTGTSVYVSGALGTVNHTLKFWSEDWSGNVEDSDAPENNATFTISKGTGTFRMWGGGSSCANVPEADAYWVIYKDAYGGNIVAEGTDGCDVVLPVSATGYYVIVYWWNYGYDPGFWDEEPYPDNLYHLTTNGQVIELN